MKVLLVRTSSMGDLIHTFYAIEDLAKYRPEIELHWICEESFVNIPKLHPFVKRTLTFSWRQYRKKLYSLNTWQTINKIKAELQAERYDMVIDSQGLIKSVMIARLARAKIHGFARDSIKEPLAEKLYHYHYSIAEQDNVIWKNRQLLALIFNYRENINRQEYNAELTIPAGTELDFLNHNKFHVVVHGASQDNKLWQEDAWRTLLAKKHLEDDLPVLLTWGNQKEYEASKRIAEGLDFIYICPKMTLTQIAKLIYLSESVVAVDTGLLHLANVLNKPTVGIYLNSSSDNTRVEGRSWEVVLGGVARNVSVDEVYLTWQQVLQAVKK